MVLKSILEILFLIITKDFIIYLLIQILITISENLFVSYKANKLFPYLKDKNIMPLKKEESTTVFKNVRFLVIYRLGGVIMNGTDNILISALINVSAVGLVSNYNLITNSLKFIVSTALNGVTASVGNLNVTATTEKKENIYFELTFVHYMLYSLCAVLLIVLLNPFIELWLGKNFVLSISISISLAIAFFVEGMRQPAYIYRTTLGLFNKAQATPYIGAITNVFLSIVLCKFFGLTGIFIATSIAQLVSYSWIDTFLIYKYEFKKSSKEYNKRYFMYFLTFVVELVLCIWVSSYINLSLIISILLKGIVVCFILITSNYLIYRKTNEFLSLYNKVFKIIQKKYFIRKNV